MNPLGHCKSPDLPGRLDRSHFRRARAEAADRSERPAAGAATHCGAQPGHQQGTDLAGLWHHDQGRLGGSQGLVGVGVAGVEQANMAECG